MQAIHLAAQNGDLDAGGLLIQAGADVNTKTSDGGNTSLDTAVSNGHAAMAGFLLRAGAPVLASDAPVVTPLHRAVMHKSTAVLAEFLAFLEQQDDDMMALGAALARGERGGQTPLHIASTIGELRCCQARNRPGCY